MGHKVETVRDELEDWLLGLSPGLRAAGERVLMSLDYCRRNGSGLREMAADVELLRQARFGPREV